MQQRWQHGPLRPGARRLLRPGARSPLRVTTGLEREELDGQRRGPPPSATPGLTDSHGGATHGAPVRRGPAACGAWISVSDPVQQDCLQAWNIIE